MLKFCVIISVLFTLICPWSRDMFLFVHSFTMLCLFIYSFCSRLYLLFRNHHCNLKSSCKKQMVKYIIIFSLRSFCPIYFLNCLILFWSFLSSQSRYYFIQRKHTKDFQVKDKCFDIFFLPFGMLFSPNERQFTETSSLELKITFCMYCLTGDS